jgi:hypothetical protein
MGSDPPCLKVTCGGGNAIATRVMGRISPCPYAAWSRGKERCDPSITKLVIMKTWFYDNYEDPVHDCPYYDGGYDFIHGGPYDAWDVLSSEFPDEIFESLISELSIELNNECPLWSGKEDGSGYLEYCYEIISKLDTKNIFDESLKDAKYLLDVKVIRGYGQVHLRLLYSHVITILETYLFDTFIKLVTKDGQFSKKYRIIKKDNKYKKNKIKESDFRQLSNSIDNENLVYLTSGFSWHNLVKVENEYNKIVNITFSPHREKLESSIEIRHDIVHRNGKNKDGEIIKIKKSDVKKLMGQCNKFVESVHKQIIPKMVDFEETNKNADWILDDSPF